MSHFSLIVPVYNTAPFLDRCVRSIVSQDYEDWELILVDDGSTDGSANICDRWASSDARIRTYHQQNEGVSAARNHALQYARGEWIWFIDSDDYIWPHSLKDLAEESDLSGSDIIVFNEESISSFQGTLDDFLRKFYFSYIVGFGPCNKLYRREIIEKHSLHFDPEESIGEDLLFNMGYYLHCSRYRFIGKTLYYYDRREGSAMTTTNSSRHVNQMRLYQKLVNLLSHRVKPLHLGILYFQHLIGGINQSKEAGLSLWESWKLVRHYRRLFPFSRLTYWRALAQFLHFEKASLLGRIRIYLMFFPY